MFCGATADADLATDDVDRRRAGAGSQVRANVPGQALAIVVVVVPRAGTRRPVRRRQQRGASLHRSDGSTRAGRSYGAHGVGGGAKQEKYGSEK